MYWALYIYIYIYTSVCVCVCDRVPTQHVSTPKRPSAGSKTETFHSKTHRMCTGCKIQLNYASVA
jgi:hypothetical protein